MLSQTLDEIDNIKSIEMIDSAKQFEFIRSMENDNSINSDLHTFCEAMALDYLIAYDREGLNKIKEKIKNRIFSAELESGGFSYPGKMQQMDSTFYSWYVIKEFERDLERDAYFEMKRVICDENKPNFKKISHYLKDYKSKYVVEVDIEVVFQELLNKYDKKEDITSIILDKLPNIIYSDDKIDLLKDSIKLYDYKNNKDKYKVFDNFLLISGISIDSLISKTGMDRRRLTDDASAKITSMIGKSWNQENININIWIDADEIHFSVEDGSRIQVAPTKRSDGFQWFLSFYINFMVMTKKELGNSILLLDNPGLQLHPSGQKDLLSTLKSLSNQVQIIYTTHSPYLLDIEHLERVKIVERKKDNGTVIKEKYYHSSLDSLKPIRDSLGFTLKDSLYISNETILVEGQSDKYILEGMLRYLGTKKIIQWNFNQLVINSPGGANKIPYIAFLMLNEDLKFVAILDNDDAGKSTANELMKFERIDENQVIKLDKIKKIENITIEDLINPSFYNFVVNKGYKTILKNKSHAEISIDEINYEEYGLADRYSKYFYKNSLGSFDKILVARQIKKELENDIDQSIIGEDTISNFKKIFDLLNNVFNRKDSDLLEMK
jgi:hypothetical protein